MTLSFEIFQKVVGIYAIFLCVLGTIGNILTTLICLRKRLRKTTFFVFMSIISFVDIFGLYTWNLSSFIIPFFGFYHDFTSVPWCKISSFLQFFSLQTSAWLLVTLGAERYMSVMISTWYSSYFNSKKAFITAGVIVAANFIVNSHVIISNGYEEVVNGTVIVKCYGSKMYDLFPMWQRVHGYLYSVAPFILLALFNLLLLQKLVFGAKNSVASKSANASAKKKSMTITVLFVTTWYILLTLPHSVTGGYFWYKLFSTESGRVVLFITQSISFTYHSTNFILCFMINKQFNKEVKEVVGGLIGKKFTE